MMRAEFSNEFRQEAARHINILNDKIIPVIVAAVREHEAQSREEGPIDLSGLLPSMAISLRDMLRGIATNNDEWLTFGHYGVNKTLEQLLDLSESLLDCGCCPEETRALRDFIHESHEIRQFIRKARRVKNQEMSTEKRPLSFSFPDALRVNAAQIAEAYEKKYYEMEEKYWRIGGGELKDVADYEKEEANLHLKNRLFDATAALKKIAGPSGIFASGMDAEYHLEKLLMVETKSLADNGYPELQEWVTKFRSPLEDALKIAAKAARQERRSGGKKSP